MFSFFKKKTNDPLPEPALPPAALTPVPAAAPAPNTALPVAPAEAARPATSLPRRFSSGAGGAPAASVPNAPVPVQAPIQAQVATPVPLPTSSTTARPTVDLTVVTPARVVKPAAIVTPEPVVEIESEEPDGFIVREAVPEEKKRSWITRLKVGLSKTSSNLTTLFVGAKIGDELYEELESALLMSDAGVDATQYLLDTLRKKVRMKS
jgi:fused signal recognition particle receptor